MNRTKILFLLKKNYSYSDYTTCKAGLFNSATFTKQALDKYTCAETKLEICIDGNSIDKEVHDFKPDICVLEAIWVTPEKLRELTLLHPKVDFVVRIHSKIPFLGNEGNAIDWIKEYVKISGVFIGVNSREAGFDFYIQGIPTIYLPNVYSDIDNPGCFFLREKTFKKDTINIGCFGAIRPMKNQVHQAVAAVGYGNYTGKKIRFHINGNRLEQGGQQVLKNLRAIFKDTDHELVEHDWMDHDKFLEVIKTMDLGLQVSLTEAFNIVTADFVLSSVPIIVSKDITWMPRIVKVDPNDTKDLLKKIHFALNNKIKVVKTSKKLLSTYNLKSLNQWKAVIKGI
jgi:glycosyltransferase involved in cell wall biosynthesis